MTANHGSTTFRNIPDVALTADNVFCRYGGGFNGNFGGTSCASPLWAGFMALVNQQAVAASKPTIVSSIRRFTPSPKGRITQPIPRQSPLAITDGAAARIFLTP